MRSSSVVPEPLLLNSLRRTLQVRRLLPAFLLLLIFTVASPGSAQENYLVATDDGTLSLYDLTNNTWIGSGKIMPLPYSVVPGPNNRLAFVTPATGYATVVDTSIGKVVARLTGVHGPTGTLTPDG